MCLRLESSIGPDGTITASVTGFPELGSCAGAGTDGVQTASAPSPPTTSTVPDGIPFTDQLVT